MAVTYTCDRCLVVLNHRKTNEGSGAHRVKMTSCIPWAQDSIPNTIPIETKDLCGACFDVLMNWWVETVK